MKGVGWCFFPLGGSRRDRPLAQPDVTSLPVGLEIVQCVNAEEMLGQFLKARGHEFSVIWVSRPHNKLRLDQVSKKYFKLAKVVYDARECFFAEEDF